MKPILLALALISSGCLGAFQGATFGSSGVRTPKMDPAWLWVGHASAEIVPASQVRCYSQRRDPDDRQCWRVDDRQLYVESVAKIAAKGTRR